MVIVTIATFETFGCQRHTLFGIRFCIVDTSITGKKLFTKISDEGAKANYFLSV